MHSLFLLGMAPDFRLTVRHATLIMTLSNSIFSYGRHLNTDLVFQRLGIIIGTRAVDGILRVGVVNTSRNGNLILLLCCYLFPTA